MVESSSTTITNPLSRRELYTIMNEFESLEYPITEDKDQLEDVTELVMKALDCLEDG
jgi:hypothetical protein